MAKGKSDNVLGVLDGLSEIMVLSNYPDAKNIMIFGFDVEGPTNVEAMGSALRRAVEHFPQFASSVKPIEVSGKRRLTWVRDPDALPELRFSEMTGADPSIPFQRLLLRHLHQSIEKEWDLLRTSPTEFHLIRVAEDRHSLLALVHHAAADGWTLSSFFRELLAHYHQIVTGEEPAWASETQHSSGVKNQVVELKTGKWHDTLFLIKKSLTMMGSRPTIPRGSGHPEMPGNHYVKSVLTREQTANVIGHLSRAKKPFMDVLVGALGTAVDEWNDALDVPRGVLAICVTVQMRGRFGDAEAPSNSSSIVLKFRPHERATSEKFSRAIANCREEQFASMADVRLAQATGTLASAMSCLPLAIRQRIAHALCQMPVIPLLIAPFGIMWPEVRNGRLTGDSYLTRAGDLDLTEFHALPYKLGYHCPLILGAYTFRKSLNLQLMSLASHFTLAETERFIKLLAEVLLDRPFGAGGS